MTIKTGILVLLTVGIFACGKNEKTGYIDINEVYSGINISKKYNARLGELERVLTHELASKREKLQEKKQNALSNTTPSQSELEEVFVLSSKMDSIEESYSKMFKDSTLKYNLQVEKIVNDLVYQYGSDNKYTYLYSPATSNSFMYADSTLDITKEVIEFINSKE